MASRRKQRDPRTDPRPGDEFITPTGYRVRINAIDGARVEYTETAHYDTRETKFTDLRALLAWIANDVGERGTVRTAKQLESEGHPP